MVVDIVEDGLHGLPFLLGNIALWRVWRGLRGRNWSRAALVLRRHGGRWVPGTDYGRMQRRAGGPRCDDATAICEVSAVTSTDGERPDAHLARARAAIARPCRAKLCSLNSAALYPSRTIRRTFFSAPSTVVDELQARPLPSTRPRLGLLLSTTATASQRRRHVCRVPLARVPRGLCRQSPLPQKVELFTHPTRRSSRSSFSPRPSATV